MSQRTLYDKIWDDHFVAQREDGSTLMYIDRHLIHEVTSPQAFDGLRQNSLIPRQVGTVVQLRIIMYLLLIDQKTLKE